MADPNGVIDRAGQEFEVIGKAVAPAFKFFPLGFIFIFLFGGNIFTALTFIALVKVLTILLNIMARQLKTVPKGRKRRVK